ncbi:protein YgfX [Marinobacterium rhizophilum]|uniref:Toxin CptA n=1 Tax=Marinobacterium rhizophilum TaxID=420402 RepID=A0ABY5HHT4_9GAMM|nr:protein YgfX [Marinobacterium rhizophilum]UTW11798.1 hypothetical protein KDW95_21545 [Marinobacterium rhizophilum]
MFSPLEVAIKPSRILWWLQALSHLVVVALLVFSALPLYAVACLVVLAGLSLWLGHRQRRGNVRALRWDADLHSIALYVPEDGWFPASKLESILVWRWLLVLRLHAGGRHRRLILVADSVTPAAFRRLSVIARYAPLQLNEPDQATRN